MTLVFHQAALGDFALVLPLLRALPGPVTLVAPWSRGRLAAALIPDLRTSDIDQFEFTRMHAAGGPSRLSPAVAELFEDATLIVDFVGSGDDAWSANLQRLAPDAPYRPLPTRPASDAALPLGEQHRQQLAQNGIALAAVVVPERPAPPAGGGVILHPGSGGESKCWPLERWLELTQILADRGHHPQLIFGEAEAHRWSDAQRQQVQDAGGRGLATLEALVEVLLPAQLYAGHDAGPTHLAAQLGIPTLALFGPTDPAVWAPVGAQVQVVAPPSPCAMDWLDVAQAADRVAQALGSASAPASPAVSGKAPGPTP